MLIVLICLSFIEFRVPHEVKSLVTVAPPLPQEIKDFVAEADRLAQKYGERFTPCKLLRDMAAKNESFHKSGNSSQAA